MYLVRRCWFKYGCETDEVCETWKYFPTIEKAVAYADRYARGIRYCSALIEDENGTIIAEHSPDRGWIGLN